MLGLNTRRAPWDRGPTLPKLHGGRFFGPSELGGLVLSWGSDMVPGPTAKPISRNTQQEMSDTRAPRPVAKTKVSKCQSATMSSCEAGKVLRSHGPQRAPLGLQARAFSRRDLVRVVGKTMKLLFGPFSQAAPNGGMVRKSA